MVEFVNNTSEPVRFPSKVPIGILDLRSLGYFNVNYEDIVSKLGDHFTFYHDAKEKAFIGHEDEAYFRTQTSQCLDMGTNDADLYAWFEPDDPFQHQSDYQMFKSKVDLKESALTPKEKDRLMYMIMKYEEAFSIRDDIRECPNIKADINVIDNLPFCKTLYN